MENNIKFRNHISVIFERVVRAVWIIIFAFVGNFLTNTEDMDSEQFGEDFWILLVVLAAFALIVIIWQVIVWYRTYISIQENTLVVERNTLNRKKNTIGLKNISNVNLEQNLLQMMLGTCTVKLDTNSLSTADQTDVTIVLKKKDAEAFRQFILGYDKQETEEKKAEQASQEYSSGMDDIIMHGIFSINILAVLIFIVALISAIGIIGEMLSNPDMTGSVLEMIMSIMVAAWTLGGFAWNIAKGFIKYLDFKIERKENKVFLSYGVLKKVAYSIPVDKINAVRLNQTALARLGKRYMVEVINVGMDDDENEAYSFFLPYEKLEKIKSQFHLLLPEFEDCLEIKEEKQPKCIWIIWIPAVIIYLLVMAAGVGVLTELVEDSLIPGIVGVTVASLWLLIAKTARYLTEGCAVHDQFLKVVSGSFGRQSLFVKYDKIQYITIKQNFIAKRYQVQKGDIHLLASLKNQIHSLPYFKMDEMEQLKKQILK